MEERKDIFKELEREINNSDMPEDEKVRMLRKVHKHSDQKINIMITGATGSGKSSTINALFGSEVAKVGVGVDPETMTITRYNLNNLVIWDSPGLGDGKENDIEHSKKIVAKLNELDNDGNALIDLVLVILDAGSRDLGTSYQLINEVIIPNLGDDPTSRILVALNKCDVSMGGRHWNFETNKPDSKLIGFMDEKVHSIHNRIYEATNVDIEPVYYSAGYKEEDEAQNPYNLSKLLYLILKHTPKNKRLVYMNNVSNKDPDVWKSNDDLKDYGKEIRNSVMESFLDSIVEGAEYGAKIGEAIFGEPGKVLGKVVGGIGGAVVSAVSGIADWVGSWWPF